MGTKLKEILLQAVNHEVVIAIQEKDKRVFEEYLRRYAVWLESIRYKEEDQEFYLRTDEKHLARSVRFKELWDKKPLIVNGKMNRKKFTDLIMDSKTTSPAK